MLEIPSRRKWESDTLELHSSSSFKTLNFYYVSQSDENRLTHEKGQKKMPVRKYQACRRFLKLGFEQ